MVARWTRKYHSDGMSHSCNGNDCDLCERMTHDCDWSEREAVVAYLLAFADVEDEGGRSWVMQFVDMICRGDHLTAAREGRLDGLRERVRGMTDGKR
jgi:hypothetical protein